MPALQGRMLSRGYETVLSFANDPRKHGTPDCWMSDRGGNRNASRLNHGVCLTLPVGMFCRLAGAEAEAELLELGGIMRLGRMEVFPFGDELHGIVARQTGLFQDGFKGLEIVGVDDQQLVFVELDFHRAVDADDGHARATVVEEQIFIIIKMAGEHWQIDALAIEIVMSAALALMAGFEDHINHGA